METARKQSWYFLVCGRRDDKAGMFGNFYSKGADCGESLHHTLNAAREQGFIDPEAIEADRLDTLEDFEIPEDCVEVNAYVSMRPTTYSFDLENEEQQFIPPTGIIKSTEESDYDYDLITAGFVAFNKDEEGFYQFELVAGKEKLIDTFLKAIGFLPSADGFWLYVHDHWENGNTEIWAAKNLSDKESIIAFLQRNKLSTLENGFVDCVVHSLSGQTNLTLGEHKTILLRTKDEDIFKEMLSGITGLGFEQTRELYTLEEGYYHWHYQPKGSLDRDSFIDLLQKENFDLLA